MIHFDYRDQGTLIEVGEGPGRDDYTIYVQTGAPWGPRLAEALTDCELYCADALSPPSLPSLPRDADDAR